MTKLERAKDNIKNFIADEKEYFDSMAIKGVVWSSVNWDCSNWLFTRGGMKFLTFTELAGRKSLTPLPSSYSEFCKALIIHIHRTKKTGFAANQKYLIECRRIFNLMKNRSEDSVTNLTRWHFEKTLETLQESNYSNIYDAASSLRVIADIIDKKGLTPLALDFQHHIKVQSSRNTYIPISELGTDKARKDDGKLPSYEALKAYAICSNSPIDDNEEILLRTIDLLIVMGQRGNEVTFIPYDCWIEKRQTNNDGSAQLDSNSREIISTGIRYFAEKNFQHRVHWLADQDIAFAKRAVERLKILTKDIRAVAKFQENSGKLFAYAPNEIIDDTFIKNFFPTLTHYYLHQLLDKYGIIPTKVEKVKLGRKEPHGWGYNKRSYYLADDIHSLFEKNYGRTDHVQLKQKQNGKLESVLTTSQLLCVRFDGSFGERFINRLSPDRVKLNEINQGLGANPKVKSIFDKRNLTEADGSRISLTSHQPRHWRNTIYELAGMTNVQQALALGRQRLDQNPTYQHTSILDRTSSHQEFLAFNSAADKIKFLHSGIREQKILGEITNIYHRVKKDKGISAAELFLSTHATALHITPFGGCTHDFSQAPCPKHLQCWNGCSHLHRTNNSKEAEKIKEQIDLGKIALKAMKSDAEGEYGADVWIGDLEKKVANMEKALLINPIDEPVKVFPSGTPVTIPAHHKKGSSVSDE